jgi:hypothetical protein
MRAALVLVATALIRAAHADTVYELPRTTARLELPERWQKLDQPQLIAAYRHPGGSVLIVSRADVPNSDAWSNDAKAKQTYADKIERGVKAAVPGYKRIARKLGKAAGVPALDLEVTTAAGATLVIRVLMYRTYALSLGIEVPALGDTAVARSIATKFAPPAE